MTQTDIEILGRDCFSNDKRLKTTPNGTSPCNHPTLSCQVFVFKSYKMCRFNRLNFIIIMCTSTSFYCVIFYDKYLSRRNCLPFLLRYQQPWQHSLLLIPASWNTALHIVWPRPWIKKIKNMVFIIWGVNMSLRLHQRKWPRSQPFSIYFRGVMVNFVSIWKDLLITIYFKEQFCSAFSQTLSAWV